MYIYERVYVGFYIYFCAYMHMYRYVNHAYEINSVSDCKFKTAGMAVVLTLSGLLLSLL